MIMTVISGLDDDDEKIFMMNLYRDYYGLVKKTVYNITYDLRATEDLVSDTFIKLLGKVSVIRTLDFCQMTAYVVYTSRSVAINYIKHRDVEKKRGHYGSDLDLEQVVSVYAQTPEEEIIRQEEIQEMSHVILRLPEKLKDLLYYKYVLDMEDHELAEILGIAPASVRQYLTRARRKARELRSREVDNHAE